MNAQDREKMYLLFENDDELTRNWAIVKMLCNRFNKLQQLHDVTSSTHQVLIERGPYDMEDTKTMERRGWTNVKPRLTTNVVDRLARGSSIDDLTKMVRDLQIGEAKSDHGHPPQDQQPTFVRRSVWQCYEHIHNRSYSKFIRDWRVNIELCESYFER